MRIVPSPSGSFFVFDEIPEDFEESNALRESMRSRISHPRMDKESSSIRGWCREWIMRARSISSHGTHGIGMLRKGVSFDAESVTVDYLSSLWDLQSGRCALSGRVMTVTRGLRRLKHNSLSASVDRIDSSVGYEAGNLQLACYACNVMKTNMSHVDFVSWCTDIVSNASR